MRYLPFLFAFSLAVAIGCASTDYAPPWQRPGLTGGKFGEVLSKAVKDNDAQMNMTSDRDLMESDFAKTPKN